MSRTFQKVIEDFTCEHCGTQVNGTGYTNHCPECLWSKHVDTSPGDRASECGGTMEPRGIEVQGREYILTHKCRKCGHTKRNKAADNDSIDALISLDSPRR